MAKKYSKAALDYYNWGVFKKGDYRAIICTRTKEEADRLAKDDDFLEVRELIH